MLTVALCKGKLIEPTLELFVKAGYGAAKPAKDSRRLVFPCPEIGMTFLIVRPTDVPTYVEYGAADLGIVGKDVLLEQDSDVYEPLDLGFGACRIAVAALRGEASRDRLSSTIRVATKYPKITERYFNQHGVPVEIIEAAHVDGANGWQEFIYRDEQEGVGEIVRLPRRDRLQHNCISCVQPGPLGQLPHYKD